MLTWPERVSLIFPSSPFTTVKFLSKNQCYVFQAHGAQTAHPKSLKVGTFVDPGHQRFVIQSTDRKRRPKSVKMQVGAGPKKMHAASKANISENGRFSLQVSILIQTPIAKHDALQQSLQFSE